MGRKGKKSNSPNRVVEALKLGGGLAGSILAIYGLVKTFRDDTAGFSWLILVGVLIWIIFLWRLFQTRRTAAYSLSESFEDVQFCNQVNIVIRTQLIVSCCANHNIWCFYFSTTRKSESNSSLDESLKDIVW